MKRLHLEYLLALAQHRGELHRQYAIDDPFATSLVLLDGWCGEPVDPIAVGLVERTYRSGRIMGRWKVYRRRTTADMAVAYDNV